MKVSNYLGISSSILAVMFAILTLSAPVSWSEETPPGFDRHIILQNPLEGVPGQDVTVLIADFAAGTSLGRHYHTGHNIVYILEGELSREYDGEEAVLLSPGDADYEVPAQIHNTTAVGRVRALVVNINPSGSEATISVE